MRVAPDGPDYKLVVKMINFEGETVSYIFSDKFYIDSKKIRHQKHLCTGSPCSPLLSYLVNKSLFDDIKEKCDEWNLTMSVYMDDMFFSSSKRIPKYQRHYIIKLII